MYSKEEVLELARELDVKFIRLQFTDIYGVLKNIAITVEQLEGVLEKGITFDGSVIDGQARLRESDMLLKPDPDTFVVFPWRPRTGAVARLMCDVSNPDGTPFAGCPRNNLKRILAEAKELGYQMNVGPEAEFYLFHTDEAGQPTTNTHDQGGYFDLSPMDLGENARREMVLALEDMGFEIESSHHEVSPGQHEIDFKYDDALATADKIVTFKFVVRAIAQRHSLHASFMAKPIQGLNGSGMHIHQSLFNDGKNAFYDENGDGQLSQTAMWYIGGILQHARAFSLISNPTVNSFKRLVTGESAPIFVGWSEQHRSSILRIPVRRGAATRIEIRNPDPTCNPYLALAAMLKAGLDGIKNKVSPEKAFKKDVYDMSQQEIEQLKIQRLPKNMYEALEEFSSSKLMLEALGDHIFQRIIQLKTEEWEEFHQQISPWEINKYISKF
ncbi:MAG: type I glutamate--ammonia ligase [Bacillota bacterium]|nr:type I glutamate--ammonia ligase [Bacillota bacterium]